MRVAVTGYRSSIIQEFERGLGYDESIGRIKYDPNKFTVQEIDLEYDAFIFCAGVLLPKNIKDQTEEEIKTSLLVNLVCVVQMCEYILENKNDAIIVIIGSESGIKGSFDTTYWMCKAAIHSYIENRKLRYPRQQLMGIAPSVIEDTKMTQDRKDLKEVKRYATLLPKQRLLQSVEVARVLHWIISDAPTYLTNTVIDLSGGKRAMS